jgi:hypothetical protein
MFFLIRERELGLPTITNRLSCQIVWPPKEAEPGRSRVHQPVTWPLSKKNDCHSVCQSVHLGTPQALPWSSTQKNGHLLHHVSRTTTILTSIIMASVTLSFLSSHYPQQYHDHPWHMTYHCYCLTHNTVHYYLHDSSTNPIRPLPPTHPIPTLELTSHFHQPRLPCRLTTDAHMLYNTIADDATPTVDYDQLLMLLMTVTTHPNDCRLDFTPAF